MGGTKRKSSTSTSSEKKISKTTIIIKEELKSESEQEEYDFSNDPNFFTCEVCSSTFVTRMSLARHMVYHEDLPKFPCNFCKSIFYQKEKLSDHINKDHGGAKFVCKYCDRNLSRRDHLLRHITNVHPEFLLETMKNEAQEVKVETNKNNDEGNPPPSSSPNQHFSQKIKTNEVVIQEDYYDNEYLNNVQVNINFFGDHSNQEENEESEIPDDYDEITKINASLNGIRVDRKHQCIECGASFMSKVNLHRHMTTHAADRPHKCAMCGKGFVRKEHLTKHMSSVHSGMKFTCEFCGKDISRKDHLIRHIRNVHPTEYLGIPQEIVENQDMDLSLSALQASGLVISERALKSMQPKPKKPYLSCDMCDQTFAHINELHEHQSIIHCDVRRFRCNYCPKAFKRKEHLTKHEVLHTGEKNFCCDNCGKEFPRKDALQDHVRRIHGLENTNGAEFPCNFCEKVFLQKTNLIRHMRNIHELLIDLEGDGNDLEINQDINVNDSGNQQSIGIAAFPMINDFIVQPLQPTCSSVVVNPIAYNGNGNISFRDDVKFIQNSLQSFSCAHCKSLFNDEKQFLLHLNTHRIR